MLLVVCFLLCSLHVATLQRIGYGDPIYHPRRPYPFSRQQSKPPSLLTELREAIDDLVGEFLPGTQ